jgi:hypothetical protein
MTTEAATTKPAKRAKPYRWNGADREAAYLVRARQRLLGLTSKAVKALNECLDSPNESVKLAAAKEVLDRAMGKAMANVQHNVTTLDLTSLHLEAVRALAGHGGGQAAAVLDHVQGVRPVVTLDLDAVQPGQALDK